MGDARTRTPVVLLFFNRPRATRRVVEAIRRARPLLLFLVADGPRASHPNEARLCEAARGVADELAPDCQVVRDYAPVNLGCGRRVASGLTRVFEQVEEAIVLEDDCVPDPTFFRYCDELLARYRHDERVMMVSGTNHLVEWKPGTQSYHYTRYGSVWGWATWRRAWAHYEFEMRSWARPEARRRLAAVLPDPEQLAHRSALCDAVANGTVDTWDYQWAYARLIRGGLAAVPSRNLVSNIGFGAGATHTMQRWAAGSDLPRYLMPFPLRAPAAVEADRDYDRAWFEWQAGRPSVDTVVAQAEGLLAARRHVEALLLLASRMGETQLRPHRASLLLRQARALAALQRPDRAVTALDEILAIEPGNAAALELRGRLASTS